MKIVGRIRRGVVALGCTGMLAIAGHAHANQYGELRISSNTTLTDDRYGDVVFNADNIALDCANHQIHISSFTKLNGGSKVAIYADSRKGINIRNCQVVGGFDYSMIIQNSSNVSVTNVTASTEAVFYSDNATSATALNLRGPIGLIVDNDVAGSYSANIRCVSQGIIASGTTNTTLFATAISGCSLFAITGSDNNSLTVNNVDLEGNSYGLVLSSDSNDFVMNSTFSGNSQEGIDFQGSSSHFTNNTALNNGVCDANQDPTSTGDSWSGNTFGTICGSVPASH